MRLALLVLAFAVSTPAAAIDPATLSKDVQPCADFDTFVNGAWMAGATLPADRSVVGSFHDLGVATNALLDRALRDLISQPAQQTTPGLKLLARYYASGMDEAAIEARGLRSLAPLLDRMAALHARDELPALLALLNRSSVATPLASRVDADRKDARRHVLHPTQAGLGLPVRDDCFRSDERTLGLQAAYRRYAQALLSAAGQPATEADLDALMAFETRLAEASRDRVGMRDLNARTNPFTPAELAAAAPGFDWAVYLSTLTAGAGVAPQRLIIGTPALATRLAEMAASAPLAVWQRYLTVRVLAAAAGLLPRAFAQAEFEYTGRVQAGLQAPPPRSEKVMQHISGRLGREPPGMALGGLYVAQASPLTGITIPAAILQPPYFSASADDALNHGGIGMTIGHEITHGFDDNGRQSDAAGNLRDWWSAADAAAFKARAERVVERYGAISPLPGHHINGRLTLGENIADLGGLGIAYEGLQMALARSGPAAATMRIDGFTPSQRFFIGNATIWRVKWRTEHLIQRLRSDTHAPGRHARHRRRGHPHGGPRVRVEGAAGPLHRPLRRTPPARRLRGGRRGHRQEPPAR